MHRENWEYHPSMLLAFYGEANVWLKILEHHSMYVCVYPLHTWCHNTWPHFVFCVVQEIRNWKNRRTGDKTAPPAYAQKVSVTISWKNAGRIHFVDVIIHSPLWYVNMSGCYRFTNHLINHILTRGSQLHVTVFVTKIKIESSPFGGPIKGSRWPLNCNNHECVAAIWPLTLGNQTNQEPWKGMIKWSSTVSKNLIAVTNVSTSDI